MNKKISTIIAVILFSLQAYSQLSFYKVSRGDVKLHSVPGLCMDIGVPVNIIGPYAMVKSAGAYMETGLFVTNNEIIYDEGNNRFHHKVVGLSLPIRGGKIVQSKYYLGTGLNINVNLHYKQKTYDYGTKDNKQIIVSEFFSKQTNLMNPSIEFYGGISIHGIGRFGVRAQIFTMSFLSPTYKEIISGVELMPYSDLAVTQNIKIMFSYNPGL